MSQRDRHPYGPPLPHDKEGPSAYKARTAGTDILARAIIPYEWHKRLNQHCKPTGTRLDDAVRVGYFKVLVELGLAEGLTAPPELIKK